MENRTIAVMGVGKAAAKPDQIVIPITLRAKSLDYEQTVQRSTEQHEALKAALEACCIDAHGLKTASYAINTSYESVRDEQGNHVRRFDGYVCEHQLNVEFALDMELLGRVLCAIAKCSAEPECSVRFTVKHAGALTRSALIAAANNAREKAEILAAASGVSLGELIRVEHTSLDGEFFSQTRMARPLLAKNTACDAIAIEPQDVTATENASFIWAIH